MPQQHTAILNGKVVPADSIDPTKHKFIGTFRPNYSTSRLIKRFSIEARIPQAEVCLQVTALALRGLSLSYHHLAIELARYTDSTFEEAAQQLAVFVRGTGKALPNCRYNAALKFVEGCRNLTKQALMPARPCEIKYEFRKVK